MRLPFAFALLVLSSASVSGGQTPLNRYPLDFGHGTQGFQLGTPVRDIPAFHTCRRDRTTAPNQCLFGNRFRLTMRNDTVIVVTRLSQDTLSDFVTTRDAFARVRGEVALAIGAGADSVVTATAPGVESIVGFWGLRSPRAVVASVERRGPVFTRSYTISCNFRVARTIAECVAEPGEMRDW